MKKLVFKDGIPDYDEGFRESYETNEDELLVEAFKEKGYEISQSDAYKVWLAFSMDHAAFWLSWSFVGPNTMDALMEFVDIVPE